MNKKTKRRKGLGLGEMFGVSSELPHLIEVDVAILQPNPDQPRQTFDKKALQSLAGSIEQHGLLQPIVVKKVEGDDGYILVAGERRFRAFQLLNRTTIPAILTDGDSRELALIENIQREDLHPMELAEGLARMIEEHGYKQSDLGKVVGKAQNTVSEILRLNKLPESIKAEYRTSDIPRSVMLEISRAKEPKAQVSLWTKAKRGLTVKESREAKRGSLVTVGTKALRAGRSFLRALAGVTGRTRELAALRELQSAIDERFEELKQ